MDYPNDEAGALGEHYPAHVRCLMARRDRALDVAGADRVDTPGASMLNRERVAWLRRFGGVCIEDNVRVFGRLREHDAGGVRRRGPPGGRLAPGNA